MNILFLRSRAGVGALCFFLLVLLGVLMYFSRCTNQLTEDDHRAIDAAYAGAVRALDKHCEELALWHDDQNAEVPAAAEELLSWSAKWKLVRGRYQEYADSVLAHHFYTKRDLEKKTAEEIALVVRDWADIEDDLSLKTDCPQLSIAKGTEVALRKGQTPDFKDDVQKAVYTELVSLVGSEVASHLATRGAVSVGLIGGGAALSWETFGVSLAVGIAADYIIQCIMNPQKDIEAKLREGLNKGKQEHVDAFRKAMMEALGKQKEIWIKDISSIR